MQIPPSFAVLEALSRQPAAPEGPRAAPVSARRGTPQVPARLQAQAVAPVSAKAVSAPQRARAPVTPRGSIVNILV